MHAPTPTEVAKMLIAAHRSAGADRFRKARALATEAKHDASDAVIFSKSEAAQRVALERRDFYLAVCRRVERLQQVAAAVDRYRMPDGYNVEFLGARPAKAGQDY
jgi:hypothetical protein